MKNAAGTHLPPEQRELMARAAKLEWISIGYTALTITLVALVVGNSQAMRTAWIEDMLSVLPQLAIFGITAVHPEGSSALAPLRLPPVHGSRASGRRSGVARRRSDARVRIGIGSG